MSEAALNIHLTDLRTVKIACLQCHAAAELPVAHFQGDPPERCFHCRAEWFPANAPRTVALQHLFRALVLLRGGEADAQCQVGFVMSAGGGMAGLKVAQ